MSMFRNLKTLASNARLLTAKQSVKSQLRHSSSEVWNYRTPKKVPKWGEPGFYFIVCAELGGGFMWWWLLTHCFYEYHHLIGHYDVPDPDKWTDEELGIPKQLPA